MDKLELGTGHFSRNLEEDGDLLLQISIYYPKTLNQTGRAQSALDDCIQASAENLGTALAQGMEQEARAARTMLPETLPYQVSGTFTTTYNDAGILSFFTDVFLYAGGVRGITYRYGSNFRIGCGSPLFLAELFPPQSDAQREITEFIAAQNVANQAAVQTHFTPENIYLTEQGLAVFYQPHTLAPPAGGIPVFTMPYTETGPFSPNFLYEA